MAKISGPRTVECYLCRHRFEVSGRVMSTSCPSCFKPVLVEDCVLSRNRPKLMMVTKLQTCGRIVVPKGTRLVAQLIEAGEGIEVAGHLHADHVNCAAQVIIGPKAHWHGDLQAPSIIVVPNAAIDMSYFDIS